MKLKSLHLCFVGNMLGRNSKHVTTQGQIVADLFTAEGYKVTCISSKISRIKRLMEIIVTLIRGFRTFDLVLLETYSGLSFIIADVTGFLCKTLNLPIVMILHGGSLPEFIKKYPHWSKRVFGRADKLVAPSDYLAERIGNWEYDIQVIPNVIDISYYSYKERSTISPNLIWMRSFHPTYNPEMAIKVLAKFRETEPTAILTMAGSDKGLESEIKMMAKDMGISEAVRFTGFLDLEMKLKEFSTADIYLCTNRVDNMPVSIIEARALGLPVVATNVGGLPYLIESGENGFLVESEDVEAMVDSIKLLIANPELTRKISENGRILADSWPGHQSGRI